MYVSYRQKLSWVPSLSIEDPQTSQSYPKKLKILKGTPCTDYFPIFFSLSFLWVNEKKTKKEITLNIYAYNQNGHTEKIVRNVKINTTTTISSFDKSTSKNAYHELKSLIPLLVWIFFSFFFKIIIDSSVYNRSVLH